MEKTFSIVFDRLLSSRTKELSERIIPAIAIFSFIVHLVIIYIVNIDILSFPVDSELIGNPISAIYTPFSFILICEVYLLVYYLPKSITTYIRKQYEIITLIIIRRLFKDFSTLELSSRFQIKGDLQFTYDLLASIILFYLLHQFFKNSKISFTDKNTISSNIGRFIKLKKIIAVFLVQILLFIAIDTLCSWADFINDKVYNREIKM